MQFKNILYSTLLFTALAAAVPSPAAAPGDLVESVRRNPEPLGKGKLGKDSGDNGKRAAEAEPGRGRLGIDGSDNGKRTPEAEPGRGRLGIDNGGDS
ncbi:hypothetical protein H2198_003131 [Neophaeococcomyces mojaviensis]|uniref:Uncharacterized protein n=1 Tax=Neophaeococcomyces mojaviensis TaxID=3383035 RepID=A0ACC3AC61_9EURO|nr:hypothetical protein H2198_003131 [Knufia sp. JES_112]